MARQVFVAKGLHDGMLGVYGSAAKAIARAVKYAAGGDHEPAARVVAEFFAEQGSSDVTRVDAGSAAVKLYLRGWVGVTVYFLPVAENGDESEAQAFVESWAVE